MIGRNQEDASITENRKVKTELIQYCVHMGDDVPVGSPGVDLVLGFSCGEMEAEVGQKFGRNQEDAFITENRELKPRSIWYDVNAMEHSAVAYSSFYLAMGGDVHLSIVFVLAGNEPKEWVDEHSATRHPAVYSAMDRDVHLPIDFVLAGMSQTRNQETGQDGLLSYQMGKDSHLKSDHLKPDTAQSDIHRDALEDDTKGVTS